MAMQISVYAKQDEKISFGESALQNDVVYQDGALMKPNDLPEYLQDLIGEKKPEIKQIMPAEGRSLSSIEVENKDGTMSMFAFGKTVKFYDRNGKIKYKEEVFL